VNHKQDPRTASIWADTLPECSFAREPCVGLDIHSVSRDARMSLFTGSLRSPDMWQSSPFGFSSQNTKSSSFVRKGVALSALDFSEQSAAATSASLSAAALPIEHISVPSVCEWTCTKSVAARLRVVKSLAVTTRDRAPSRKRRPAGRRGRPMTCLAERASVTIRRGQLTGRALRVKAIPAHSASSWHQNVDNPLVKSHTSQNQSGSQERSAMTPCKE
jgi:hypothetical protein